MGSGPQDHLASEERNDGKRVVVKIDEGTAMSERHPMSDLVLAVPDITGSRLPLEGSDIRRVSWRANSASLSLLILGAPPELVRRAAACELPNTDGVLTSLPVSSATFMGADRHGASRHCPGGDPLVVEMSRALAMRAAGTHYGTEERALKPRLLSNQREGLYAISFGEFDPGVSSRCLTHIIESPPAADMAPPRKRKVS